MTQSTRRNPDRMIQSFLEAGPTELADRVFDAVLDDVHRHRQQAATGLWRIPTMSRSALVAAAAVAAVALVAVIIGVTNPFSGVGTTPTPTAQPSSTPAANLGEPIGNLVAGTYRTSSFTEPFTVDVPAMPSALATGPAVGDLWAGRKTLRIKLGVTPGATLGAVTIHDDVPLAANLCDAGQGLMSDVPSSVAAVGAWLTSSTGLGVAAGTTIEVDGRQGMSWDIALPAGCADAGSPDGAVVSLEAGEHHRVYAIPTGTDTIVIFTWGGAATGARARSISPTSTPGRTSSSPRCTSNRRIPLATGSPRGGSRGAISFPRGLQDLDILLYLYYGT